jgi:hypothetical protein
MKQYTVLIFAVFLCFSAGCSDGLNQTLYAHYSAFKAKFPHANDAYWKPDESWVNKYKNYPQDTREKFLGSKTVFVAFTDAYHVTRQLYGFGMMLGVLLFTLSAPILLGRSGSNMPQWLFVGMALGACWLAKSAGFHLIYSLYFS